MKKGIFAVLLLLSSIFNYIASNAQGTLIHYWHFNNFTTTYTYPTFPKPLAADYSRIDTSKAKIVFSLFPGTSSTYHSTATILDAVTTVTSDYDTVNLRLSQPAGNGFRPRNPLDSVYLLFYIPTTNYQNILLTYASQSSSTTSGDTYQYYDYSIDSGATWITTGLSKTYDSAWLVYHRSSISFSNSAVNNNPKLVFRIHFVGHNTGTSGNNRFDNVSVDGDSIISPVLIDYWHFNNFTTTYTYPTFPAPIDADYSVLDTSKAKMVYALFPGTSGTYHSTATIFDAVTTVTSDYDTVNLRLSQPAGNGIRPRNPMDSVYLKFYMPTTGYHDVILNYASQSSSTSSGDTYQYYDYSTDSGATWVTTGLSKLSDSAWLVYHRSTITFTSDSSVNNTNKFVFRIHFIGHNTGTSGNNRFDNVSLDGIPYIINNTITTTTASYGPYCNASSSTLGVAYTSTGTYSGTYSVQLSNSSGSFSSGTTTIATATVSPLSATIPSGTTPGTYRVRVINSSPAINGTDNGSNIVINGPPTAYSVTGGGSYCAGGSGVTIGLGNSQSGVTYQLYNGATSVGSPVAGTGSSISFGSITAAGTYSVTATNTTTTGCTTSMTGSATVTINPLPSSITSPGNVCIGNTISLFDSVAGGNYTSNASTVAGVGSTGIVTGISTGSATISYTLPTGCYATTIVTVNTAVPLITGTTSLCAGSGTVLNDGASGGTWSSSSTLIATIGSTGIVSGISSGNPVISYTISTGCYVTTILTVNPLPATITGTMNVCPGSSATLADGTTGGTWISGTTAVATIGSTGIVSGILAGTSVITYVLPTGCSVQATVTVNSLPGAITGVSPVCIGNTITLSTTSTGGTWSSSNVSQGTVSSSGVVTGIATGNPSISYTLPTGCSATTITTINPLPAVITGTMNGCAGSAVTLADGSGGGSWISGTTTVATIGSATGIISGISAGTSVITYQLPTGCTANAVVTVNPLPATITGIASVCVGNTTTLSTTSTGGTWSSSNILQGTISPTGSVTGIATGNPLISYTLPTGCTTVAVLTVNPLPSTITGTMNVCAGSSVTLTDGSTGGTWISGTTSIANIDFTTGVVTAISAGTSTITYTLSTGCTTTTGITVNALPAPITGITSVCAGSNTTLSTTSTGGTWSSSNPLQGTVSSTGSVAGIAAGTPAISYTFPNGCSVATLITVNPLPAVISGATNICSGLASSLTDASGPGTWSSSNTSVVSVGATTGIATGITTGSATISFALKSTGCITSSLFTITLSPSAYVVRGGGGYCAGSAGPHIMLSNSGAGFGYQAFIGSTAVGGVVPGTGLPLDMGGYTTSGTYTIVANPGSSCATTMYGSATVTVNPLPNAYAVNGGGGYCTSGSGVHVGLAGSDVSVDYQLYKNGTVLGSPIPGSGTTIDFGLETAAGTYTVVATNSLTGCVNNMTGNTTVSVNSLPTAFSITGGGGYCPTTTGSVVGLSNSTTGISYQLYVAGTPAGAPVTTTGGAFSFGPQTTAGTYTVIATNTVSACTSNMTGSTIVSVNPLPTVFTVTGGGTYCTGTTGVHIGLNSSTIGVNYQIYNGSSTAGIAVAGTGAPLDLGIYTAAGTYTVSATSPITTCSNNMTGSATVTTNPLPNQYTISTGGGYCLGGTGVDVNLPTSYVGVSYQLYNGLLPVGTPMAGTGSLIDFGNQTAAGTYTIKATNTTTGCVNTMTGSSVIVVNNPPIAFPVTGGGSYCSGGTGVNIGMSSTTSGVSYQLYNGISTAGIAVVSSGGPLSFGAQTAPGGYTVVATSPAGCSANMTGSVFVSINPLPIAYTVGGGGGYCAGTAGTHITLSGSGVGRNYQLYNGSSTVGAPVPGTGGPLDFGLITAVGTYTVSAVTTATGCASGMAGSTVVAINPLPTPYPVTVGGGGLYCAGGVGVPVGVSTLATGIGYQLYRNGTAIGGPVYSSGSAITFGNETLAGTYSVVATDPTTGCTGNMSTTVTVSTNPLPVPYTVRGGGGYCLGSSTGVNVILSGSATGTTYQLFNSGVSAGTFPGTGSPINFGAITATGTYSVIASNAITSCSVNMLSSVIVTTNPLPLAYTVLGGGTYCIGGTSVPVALSGSSADVNYQLYHGSAAVGSPIAGTGSGLYFGLETATGPYAVIATDAVTGCKQTMTLTVSVTTTSLPTPYPVTGGGGYCAGGAGSVVNLAGSLGGVAYQLFVGGSPTGGTVSGTGGGITFGPQTTPGTYTVVATGGCAGPMTSSVAVSINPLPIAYTVSGGGSYCTGGAGLRVSLGSSQTVVKYQLYNAGSPVGGLVAGTGAELRFSALPVGSYEIGAVNITTSCTNNMADTVAITTNPLPVAYALTGGGNYCASGTGATITLAGSAAGVNYQLYNGTAMVGTAVAGTSAAITFGPYTATGVYSIVATDVVTGCNGNMANNDTIGISALPTAYAVTGGGNYCVGGTGMHINLGGSQSGTTYQLYNGTTATGTALTGTGAALDLGLQTATGVYTIQATNTTTGCTNTMTGSAAINVTPLPLAYAITGGGNYCIGGSGLHIGLSGSQSSVSYQLVYGSGTVSTITGSGSSVDFGLQTATGTYKVVATNTTTGCVNNIPDSTIISTGTTPHAYVVTSSGSAYCPGSAGIIVYLSGSDAGVSYQLYRGTTPIGTGVPGGGALDFGPQTTPGTYTVIANSTVGSCTGSMAGSASVSIAPLPNVYTVLGGGSYCAGGAGVHISLSGTQAGTGYQLYKSGSPVGSIVTGTGGALDFGAQTATGSYTAVAISSIGCTANMSGSPAIGTTPAPAVFTTTGGGNYCSGGTGVAVGLSSSVTGINYKLYYSVTAIGGPIAGTGLPLNMGMQTEAGSYTIVATNSTTGCSSTMSSSATIGINTAPAVYTVSGGGNYCPGSAGVHVGLGNSATGTTYQLYDGTTAVGSAVTGIGAAIDFGAQTTAGLYKVTAHNTATGCTANMSGTAVVGISTLPDVYTITGGGNYCSGTAGVHIGLSGSGSGISYQIFNTGSIAAPVMTGTGGALDFGAFTTTGPYTVVATNGTTTCTSNMAGTASVSMTTTVIPAVTITTGGSDTVCAGLPITFTAATTDGGGSPAYQWAINSVPVTTSTGSYTYLPADGDVVSVILSSSVLCAMPMTATNHISMTVLPQLMPIVTIAADPGNTVCSGTRVTFTATAVNGGSAPAYQWRKNGGFESTTSSYTFLPENGDVVYCQLISSYHCKLENSVNSPSVSMNVATHTTPTLVVTADPDAHIANGEVATLHATITNGVAPVSYQWYVNGGPIPGATLPFYTNNNFVNLDSVSCIVSTTGTCAGDTGSAGIRIYVSNVGVQQVNSAISNVQLVPNPNKGDFILKGSLGTTVDEEVTIEITNMLGQSIYNSKANVLNGSIDEKIQLGNIANGMYLVNLHTANNNQVFHMIIEQ